MYGRNRHEAGETCRHGQKATRAVICLMTILSSMASETQPRSTSMTREDSHGSISTWERPAAGLDAVGHETSSQWQQSAGALKLQRRDTMTHWDKRMRADEAQAKSRGKGQEEELQLSRHRGMKERRSETNPTKEYTQPHHTQSTNASPYRTNKTANSLALSTRRRIQGHSARGSSTITGAQALRIRHEQKKTCQTTASDLHYKANLRLRRLGEPMTSILQDYGSRTRSGHQNLSPQGTAPCRQEGSITTSTLEASMCERSADMLDDTGQDTSSQWTQTTRALERQGRNRLTHRERGTRVDEAQQESNRRGLVMELQLAKHRRTKEKRSGTSHRNEAYHQPCQAQRINIAPHWMNATDNSFAPSTGRHTRCHRAGSQGSTTITGTRARRLTHQQKKTRITTTFDRHYSVQPRTDSLSEPVPCISHDNGNSFSRRHRNTDLHGAATRRQERFTTMPTPTEVMHLHTSAGRVRKSQAGPNMFVAQSHQCEHNTTVKYRRVVTEPARPDRMCHNRMHLVPDTRQMHTMGSPVAPRAHQPSSSLRENGGDRRVNELCERLTGDTVRMDENQGSNDIGSVRSRSCICVGTALYHTFPDRDGSPRTYNQRHENHNTAVQNRWIGSPMNREYISARSLRTAAHHQHRVRLNITTWGDIHASTTEARYSWHKQHPESTNTVQDTRKGDTPTGNRKSVEQRTHGRYNTARRCCGALAGGWRLDEMVKTGRTRARSRSIQQEGQRQPDFADTTNADAPSTMETHASTLGDGASLEGTPPERQEDVDMPGDSEGEGGPSDTGRGAQGEKGEEREGAAGSSDARQNIEGESEEGSLSEESEDSQGRTGEEKDQRIYWKEVEKKVEMGVGALLEKAHAARYATYEKQVRELGVIVDPTSSEGEEEGDIAERRRQRRKEREVEMGKRRIQKNRLYSEYL
eukprot:2892160-Pleurochrysis_carterae.AAC.1